MWPQELRMPRPGSVRSDTEAKVCQQEAHMVAQHHELQVKLEYHSGNPG